MKHFLLITLFLWTGAKPTQALSALSCNSVSATIFSNAGVDTTAFGMPSWFSDYCAAVVLHPPIVDFDHWPGSDNEYISYVLQNYQAVYDSESTYFSDDADGTYLTLSSWSTLCCRLIFDHLTCGDGTELSGQNECVPTNKKDGVVSPANCNILKTAYKSGAGCGC